MLVFTAVGYICDLPEESRYGLLGSVTYGRSEYGHYQSARENGDDEPGFGLPVRLKLCGKGTISEVLEFSAPNELGESGSPDALEVSGPRTAQHFVDFRMARGKRFRELAASPD